MTASTHPAAPHSLPGFITAPGETDTLLVVMAIFLVVAVMTVGLLFLRLHTLPERMAHSSKKLQFELVAILGLLALFTHIHLFWVAGLILAVIDIPDFITPLRRIATSSEKIAGIPSPLEEDPAGMDPKPSAPDHPEASGPDDTKPSVAAPARELSHA